jgi:hypothetical protein
MLTTSSGEHTRSNNMAVEGVAIILSFQEVSSPNCVLSQKPRYDRRSVGQSVLVSGSHLRPATNSSLSCCNHSSKVTSLLTWCVLSDERSGLSSHNPVLRYNVQPVNFVYGNYPADYCDNHAEHIHTLLGKRRVVHIDTTWLQSVRLTSAINIVFSFPLVEWTSGQ